MSEPEVIIGKTVIRGEQAIKEASWALRLALLLSVLRPFLILGAISAVGWPAFQIVRRLISLYVG
jgi:hypothetical protein